MSVAEYERLLKGREQQSDWKGLVNQARAQIQVGLGNCQLPPSEEILRQIREERDAQILAIVDANLVIHLLADPTGGTVREL